jgi:hypothetical protein
VFRVAVFSIVLSLAVAPQATLLCALWCQPSDAATSGWHHHDQMPSASVKSDERCAEAALSVPSFIREDGPSTARSADVAHAAPVPRFQLDLPESSLRIGGNATSAWALERRPLETTLRL